MIPLQLVTFLLVAVGAMAVVLTRDPSRQAIVAGFYGFALVLLFVVLQAPDVALSALVVSVVALPAMLLLALAQVRERKE